MKIFLLSFLLLTFVSIRADTPNYKYDFAVCAVFQDEAKYLKEWIEFHKLVGAQHFYLYNNLSSDNFEEVLRPYIDSGEVDVIEWPYRMKQGDRHWMAIQWKAHTDCVKRAKREKVRWVAFIDIDEYLFPLKEGNILDTLIEYEQEGIGGVAVNWQLYGTSFLKQAPEDKLLIESFRYKARKNYRENEQVKTIARPEYTERCRDSHTMHYRKGYRCVTENCEPIRRCRSKYVTVNKLRINHYWTRDEEYFYNRKIKRRQEKVHLKEDLDELLERLRRCNECYERVSPILRYAPELKKRIELR